MGLALLCLLFASVAQAETKKLKLYFLHTGEKDEIAFKRNGKFIDSGLKKINHFLRDWRRNEPTKMDPRLLELIWEVYRETGSKNYIHVVSGYRSPATNSLLRKRGRGVAKKSQHTLGKALDFFIPGVKLQTLRNIGLRKGLGGVGYYPRSGSPFVHMDTGRVRHWPRMSRKELVKVFPKGNTLHVPTDGKPLKRYNQAKAEYERKVSGRGKIVVAKAEEIEKKPGFFARVLGRGGDDDEGASVAAATAPRPVRTTAPPVATPRPQANVTSTGQAVLTQGPIVESVASQMAALPTSVTPVPTRSRRKLLLAQADQEPAVPEPNQPDPAIEVARPEDEATETDVATLEQASEPNDGTESPETALQEEPLEVANAEIVEPELPSVAIPVAAKRPEPTASEEPLQETEIALLEPEVGLTTRDGSPAIPARRPAAITPEPVASEPEQAAPVVIASAPARLGDDYIDLRAAYQQSVRQQLAGDLGQDETAPARAGLTESAPETQADTQVAFAPIEPGTLQRNELAVPATSPNRPELVEIAAAETETRPLEPGVEATGDTAFPVTSPQRPDQTVEIAAAEPLQPIEPGTSSAGLTAVPLTSPERPVEVAIAEPEPIEPGTRSNGLPGVPLASPDRVAEPVVVAAAQPEPLEPGTLASGMTGVPVTSPNRPEQPAAIQIAEVAPSPIEPGANTTGLPAFPSTGPVRLRQATEQRLAFAFPKPVEPGALSTGQTGHPTTNPQRVEVATALEPIEPNTLASGDITAPVTSPRRETVSVATLIEEAQALEPIDPDYVLSRSGGLPKLSPERVKQDQAELAALDAQRRAATSQSAPKSLIDLKSTVIDSDVLGRTSLASAQPLTKLDQIRAPAYGQNIIREKPVAVLSQGFTRQPNTNIRLSFSGNAVQLLNFDKFN